MSIPIYTTGGLRAWRQSEIRIRNRIRDTLVDCVQDTLLGMNQMWGFEEVDTPVMMPHSEFSCAYDASDIFMLRDQISGEDYALRAETTIGSYRVAEQILRESSMRMPMCVYTMGQSFRQESSDGATAAKLRFNAFYQLEFQCVYSAPWIDESGKPKGTQAPIPERVREALVPVVQRITGLETRLVPSDRLPSYSMETIDIEVLWRSPNSSNAEADWKEVASTSIRTDFNQNLPNVKDPVRVFEVAFGIDRMVAIAQNRI